MHINSTPQKKREGGRGVLSLPLIWVISQLSPKKKQITKQNQKIKVKDTNFLKDFPNSLSCLSTCLLIEKPLLLSEL